MSYAMKTFMLVTIPVLANALLAITAFFLSPGDFHENSYYCYITVWTALGAAATSFIGFAIHDLGPFRTMLAVAAQGVALIIIFAGIYRGHGLLYSGELQSLLNDGESALYFSVVTWTTLGYGDFSPPADIRLIAAIQALLGYVFLGTSVGLGTFLLCRENLPK